MQSGSVFLRFLQGYAVFENGDLPVAVAFVLGLLPICGAQDQVKQIVRGGRLGVQIDPAGLFLCQGGVGGNFDAGQTVAAAAFQPDFQFADKQGTASVCQCPGNAVYSLPPVK